MSTLKLHNSTSRFVIAILLIALVMWVAPATFAAKGPIGEKPDIGQGDGIPQDKPGLIRAGEQLGMEQGDASKGDNQPRNDDIGDPANEGGDGIPNGGPIEGTGHKGKGDLEDSIVFGLYAWLLGL